MSLKFRLASRNLFHDRLRLVATIVGIVFSIVLVTVQMGLYVGFGRMVTTMIDHAPADLWIMPLGTKCFEDPSLLDDRQRFRTLAVNGVAEAAPLVVGYAQWRLPSGTTTPVFIVGSELRGLGLRPWDLVAGRLDDLSIPGAVAIDQSYFDRLGIGGTGANAEIRDQKVQVMAVTRGIRSFTTTPYAFTGLDRARAYTGISPTSFATAAGAFGCSVPVRAPPCSRAPCSASSLAPSSSRKHYTRAPRIIWTSSQHCVPSDRPARISTR